MVSKKGRTRGSQSGMRLPEGITSSKPSTLWKIIKVIKDEGPGDYLQLTERMKKRWRYYLASHSLYTVLGGRTDVFVVVEDRGKAAGKVYDLKEEIRDAMD